MYWQECHPAGDGEAERWPERTKALAASSQAHLPRLAPRGAPPCKAAGIQRIPHDFRRTAVRNFERAGVPRTTAMAMVDHKTESIYRRYSIVDQAMLDVGAAKLDQLQQAQGLSQPVVVSIKRRQRSHRSLPTPARK